MKKVLHYVLIISIISLTLLVSACSNSYDDMIEQFNLKNFKKGYNTKEHYTISDDFLETDMLEDVITVNSHSVLNLIAPFCGDDGNYEWKVIVPEKDNHSNRYIEKEYCIGNERILFYEIPGVLNIDKRNTLILTVSNNNGEEYTDSAIIFIE